DVTSIGSSQERCLTCKVHPLQSTSRTKHESPNGNALLGARIWICSLVQQHLNKFQKRLTIDSVLERCIVEVHIPDFHCSPKRSSSIPVAHVNLRSLFDEETRNVDMIVADCHQQRRDVIRILLFQIGTRCHENLCGLEPSVARGV